MIRREEILELASELGLRPQVVEKDYVLGWILAGIARDEELHNAWVFKGGTCLKKCYFETYRFSEDLDFTIKSTDHLNSDFLIVRFSALSEWLYDETGVELPADKLRFDVWDTDRGSRAGQGRIAYRGPIAPKSGDLPRINLDLTADEKLVLPPALRPVAHPYSDFPGDGINVHCYSFEEVFGEKVRALGERARPRDLYDVINLFRNDDFQVTASVIMDVLKQKCAFKNIAIPSLATLLSHRDELFADWETMLSHQLPFLPPAQSFWDALETFFNWLNGAAVRTHLAAYPMKVGESVLRSPVGGLPVPARIANHIEVIRFAASNRLCVDLEYEDENGNRKKRLIEAYSLRRTSDNNILLHAVRHADGGERTYRVDRIRGATITSQVFTPRYTIELTPTGLLSAPLTQRSAFAAPKMNSPLRPKSAKGFAAPKPAKIKTSSNTKHVFRCTVCGKTFRKSTYDGTLGEHKNKQGQPCFGRIGTFVKTDYKW